MTDTQTDAVEIRLADLPEEKLAPILAASEAFVVKYTREQDTTTMRFSDKELRHAFRQGFEAALNTIEADNAKLREMDDAPKDASWILAWFKSGFSVRPLPIHWASDLSGSEQPAYQGWFSANGLGSFYQVDLKDCLGWEPTNKAAASAALKDKT